MNLLESTRPDTGEELLAVEDLRIPTGAAAP